MAKPYRREVLLQHPPETVWVALTDPHALAEWLMPNNFTPALGAKFRFQIDSMPGCYGLTECEVLEYDPPRRMVWSWLIVARPGKKQAPPMQVAWTLTPESGGTRLVLEQFGLEAHSWFVRFSMGWGWGTMIKRWIPKVLRNVKDGTFTPGAIPLAKRCYKTKTLPPEIIR